MDFFYNIYKSRQSGLDIKLQASTTEYLIYKTRQSRLDINLSASTTEYLLRIIFPEIEY